MTFLCMTIFPPPFTNTLQDTLFHTFKDKDLVKCFWGSWQDKAALEYFYCDIL